MAVSGEEVAVEHGIAGGAYDNLGYMAYGHLCPFLSCPCGFDTLSGAAGSWEEAGALLDEHLAHFGRSVPSESDDES